MNELLGARIKELRMKQEMTQEQLAKVLDSSKLMIVQIERGNVTMTLERLLKIAKALSVSVKDITGVLDEMTSVVGEEAKNVSSIKEILDMLDLFYANKHIYQQLQSIEY